MEPEVVSANQPDADDDSIILAGADPGSAAGQLLNLFLTARFARRNQDTIWMKAFRNIRGVYGGDVTLADGWSKAFVNMTSPKIQTAVAIIADVMLPQDKTIWNIETTPEPYMPEFTEYLAQQNAQQGIDATYDVFMNQIFLESQRRCANLQSKVNDGFAEGDFKRHFYDLVWDTAAFGSGCIFGPFPQKRVQKRRGGKKSREYLYPEFEWVSIFDLYPDPGARSVDDCLYVVRRRVVNKAWLSRMRSAGGFSKDRIDQVMTNAPDGNWTPEPWETDMIITNNNNQMYTYRHRYVVYDFWIKKTTKELIELGVDPEDIGTEDDNEMHTANIMVTNGQIIRAVISKFHEKLPVRVSQCRKNVHSIWGTGFAEMMFDSQAAGSACERAANDTMASIARPQTIIDMSRVKMGTDSMKPHPGKLWYVNNSVGGASKPIEIFYPPNILREVLEREASLKDWADEQTGIPRFLTGIGGSGVHNRTLGGAELQWNNANNPFKTVVTNLENMVVIPCVDSVVDFYLTYEYSDEIDCDYKVVSTGLQGLVAKQTRVASIMELLKAVGNNDYWQSRINSKRVGEILEDAFSLTGEQIFLNDADAEAKMQRMQEMKANQPPPVKPDIPVREAKLKILSETDKGSAAYPVVLEEAMEEMQMVQNRPAAAAALNIMREEVLTAHRQFTSQADSDALGKDVNPDGSGQDIQDAKGSRGPSAPTAPSWQMGQPGQIGGQGQQPQGGHQIVQAPLPLGVSSLGTPKAESLVQHPERYAASIPPGHSTNPADVGGIGLPGQIGGK